MALLLHTALLAADGSVAGQVTDLQGNLVAGATLRLSGAGAAQPGVATGAGSPVRVSRIDAGDLHTLSASAGNFEPATETFPLGRSESLTARPFGDTKGSCAEATYSTPTPCWSQIESSYSRPSRKFLLSVSLADPHGMVA